MNEEGSEFDPQRLVLVVSGGLWAVPTVADQPRAVLERWQVYKVDDRDLHLVGWCEASSEGRVSRAVLELDTANRCCRTESGRIYELNGLPGLHPDANYVWHRWVHLYRVTRYAEVSREIEAAFAAAGKGAYD